MREWQDVAIKVSFKLPSADAAACIGSRVDQMWSDGIVLCVDGAGRYNLTVGGPTLPKAPDSMTAETRTSYADGVSKTLVEAGTWHVLELETIGDKATGALDGKPLFTNTAIRSLDTGFAALGMNNWFAVEFDDFSIHQAGDRWVQKSACGAAKVGDVLTVRNCSTNGLAVDDQVPLALSL